MLVAALIFDSSVRETWLPLVSGGTLCVAEGVFEITEGGFVRVGTVDWLKSVSTFSLASPAPATITTIPIANNTALG